MISTTSALGGSWYLPLHCPVCSRLRLLVYGRRVWCEKCGAEGETLTDASPAAEITRLEARLAEVEAERDEWRRAFPSGAKLVEDNLRVYVSHAIATEADLATLRAAVRPLVEAAGSARHYMRYGEGDPFQLVATIDAIMADPAIAALLEGGNDAH